MTLCVASHGVFITVAYFVMTQSGNFWIYPRSITMAVAATAYRTVEQSY